MKPHGWVAALALGILPGAGLLRQVPAKEELRPLDAKGWVHAKDVEGSDPHEDAINRNRQKNRAWTATKAKVEWTVGKFVETAAMYDLGLQLIAQSREGLMRDVPGRIQSVNKFENRLVSVTGYLGNFYSVGGEDSNYGSDVYHDWHLELFAHPVWHEMRIGDETPIICEVTRFTERKLYDKGVRLQKLAAFVRTGPNGRISFVPTGHPSHKVRITGYLLWDDGHNQPWSDVGPSVQNLPKGQYHHPWRQTAWEIHPVTAIEDLGEPK